MKKTFLLASLVFIAITSFAQRGTDYSSAGWISVPRPQHYLTLANNDNSIISKQDEVTLFITNSDSQIQKNYQGKRRLFVTLTIPLIAGYLIANQSNNKNLAGGFAACGLVTSSLGFYFMIKEDKQKKEKN